MRRLLAAALVGTALALAACSDPAGDVQSEEMATEIATPEPGAPVTPDAGEPGPAPTPGEATAAAALDAASEAAATDDPIETDPGAAGDPGSGVR